MCVLRAIQLYIFDDLPTEITSLITSSQNTAYNVVIKFNDNRVLYDITSSNADIYFLKADITLCKIR